MNAEIITIGTELLLGEIVDTNAAYIARQLRTIGLDLYCRTTVGDNQNRIVDALNQALARADVVITTGGLGPTVDDVTREAAAEASGRSLELRQALLEQIEARFARWNAPIGENNRRQALVPQGARAIENPVGTAPAFAVETERGTIICLPGVPREMEYLMENAILPYLRRSFDLDQLIQVRVLRTAGIGESRIDAAIADLETAANPTVGLSAHAGQTDVRITAKATNQAKADRLIAPVEAEIRRRLGINLYGVEKETVEEVLVGQLAQAGWTLATAEAGTGGLLTNRLANAPGSEAIFRGGTTAADVDRLGEALGLAELGPDPEEAARALAEHIACGERCIGLVALVLSRSGQEQATSTEGTIVAWTTPQGVRLKRHGFGGHTAHAARWATTRALDLVRRWWLRRSE